MGVSPAVRAQISALMLDKELKAAKSETDD